MGFAESAFYISYLSLLEEPMKNKGKVKISEEKISEKVSPNSHLSSSKDATNQNSDGFTKESIVKNTKQEQAFHTELRNSDTVKKESFNSGNSSNLKSETLNKHFQRESLYIEVQRYHHNINKEPSNGLCSIQGTNQVDSSDPSSKTLHVVQGSSFHSELQQNLDIAKTERANHSDTSNVTSEASHVLQGEDVHIELQQDSDATKNEPSRNSDYTNMESERPHALNEETLYKETYVKQYTIKEPLKNNASNNLTTSVTSSQVLSAKHQEVTVRTDLRSSEHQQHPPNQLILTSISNTQPIDSTAQQGTLESAKNKLQNKSQSTAIKTEDSNVHFIEESSTTAESTIAIKSNSDLQNKLFFFFNTKQDSAKTENSGIEQDVDCSIKDTDTTAATSNSDRNDSETNSDAYSTEDPYIKSSNNDVSKAHHQNLPTERLPYEHFLCTDVESTRTEESVVVCGTIENPSNRKSKEALAEHPYSLKKNHKTPYDTMNRDIDSTTKNIPLHEETENVICDQNLFLKTFHSSDRLLLVKDFTDTTDSTNTQKTNNSSPKPLPPTKTRQTTREEDQVILRVSETRETLKTVTSETSEVSNTAPSETREALKTVTSETSEVSKTVPSETREALKTVTSETSEVSKTAPSETREVLKTVPWETREAFKTVTNESSEMSETVPSETREVLKTMPSETGDVQTFPGNVKQNGGEIEITTKEYIVERLYFHDVCKGSEDQSKNEDQFLVIDSLQSKREEQNEEIITSPSANQIVAIQEDQTTSRPADVSVFNDTSFGYSLSEEDVVPFVHSPSEEDVFPFGYNMSAADDNVFKDDIPFGYSLSEEDVVPFGYSLSDGNHAVKTTEEEPGVISKLWATTLQSLKRSEPDRTNKVQKKAFGRWKEYTLKRTRQSSRSSITSEASEDLETEWVLVNLSTNEVEDFRKVIRHLSSRVDEEEEEVEKQHLQHK